MQFRQHLPPRWYYAILLRIRLYRCCGKSTRWEVWQRREQEILLLLPPQTGYSALSLEEQKEFEKVLSACGRFGVQMLWSLKTMRYPPEEE